MGRQVMKRLVDQNVVLKATETTEGLQQGITMVRFVGWKHQSAVWGHIPVCHGKQLGPLVMLSLSLDRDETSIGALWSLNLMVVLLLIFICALNDPLRTPAGFPRRRAAEMKMCVLKVYWDMPSASVPIAEWRKQDWAEGELSCDTVTQSQHGASQELETRGSEARG